MNGQQLQAGDVVRLKSGGVNMTVEEVEGAYVNCVWFDGKRPERGTFPIVTVEKV
jgi:uncharacterized protein YodC (DUF2158 family)